MAVLLSAGLAYALDADFYVTAVEHTKLRQDSYGYVNITLKNLGASYAAYARVTFDPEDRSPIDPVGSPRRHIGRVREGILSEQYFGIILQNEEVELGYRVYVKKGTPPGVYYVPLLVEWKDEQFNTRSQVLQLALPVEGEIKLSVAGVATTPREVRSGRDNVKLTVRIANTGDAEARNVRAGLLLDAPFAESFSGAGESFLGNIKPYAEATAEFHLDVAERAEPGKYELPLVVEYEDSAGRDYREERSISILVEPAPYFELSGVELVPENPTPGDRVTLKLRIRNTGGEKAENTDIRVIRESSQPFDFTTRSDFIGSLKPGEVGEGAIEFEVKEDAVPKEYRLRVSIRCTGDSEAGDDNVYVQEIAVPVKVAAGSPEEGGKVLYAGAGVLLLLLLAVGVRKLRR
ncbi:MAG: hypothetical protein GXO66_01095 [Euryarchaeota archaeon]|nr:hypothetical protein [Euryarchaeota archaeon]